MRESGFDVAVADGLAKVDWLLAASEGIAVALFDLRDWECWISDARSMLDAVEIGRVDRQYFPIDRQRLVLAYALRRLWLSEAMGIPASEVVVDYDGSGCPLLPGKRHRFSLSHSGAMAAFALSMRGPVGVDIEPIERAGILPGIADFVCAADEVVAMDAPGASARGEALLEIWVRKEALLKASGTGLAHEMRSFCAPLDRSLPLPGGEPGVKVRLTMIDAGSAARAAVAGGVGLPVLAAWIRCQRDSG